MASEQPVEPEEEQDFWFENEAAKKLNGLYANRIYVQPLGEGMVRINFGEVLDEDSSYHTAIVVTAQQAKQFAQVIFNVATAVVEREYVPVPPPIPAAPAPTNTSAIADIMANAQKGQEGDNGRE